ncbi:hypothetical protein B0H14DRAFT_2634628 [Mycena olivaceomarginata]|nr:hypothetical protein B0H14DRAFT_2634628 [Mycena olivaceomarginata]
MSPNGHRTAFGSAKLFCGEYWPHAALPRLGENSNPTRSTSPSTGETPQSTRRSRDKLDVKCEHGNKVDWQSEGAKINGECAPIEDGLPGVAWYARTRFGRILHKLWQVQGSETVAVSAVDGDRVLARLASDCSLESKVAEKILGIRRWPARNVNEEDIAEMPGIKLLDFSKAISAETEATEFSSTKAQALSKTLDLLKPLKGDDVKQWMQYWTESS